MKIEMVVTRIERVVIGSVYGYEVECSSGAMAGRRIEIRTTEQPNLSVDDEVTVTVEKGWES
jgi:hypothetical protein